MDEDRFLVLAPTGRDGPLTCELLRRAGIDARVVGSFGDLAAELGHGAAGIILAEEVLRPEIARQLADLLARQEAWSDLPILIFTGENATIQARQPTTALLQPLGNVTLLDRPLRPITMLSAARSALRVRRRQYEARDELVRQQSAVRHRDQFLAMLGHELRTPLSSILYALDLIDDRPGADEERRLLVTMRRQGRNLARLVDDLLDVARVTSDKVVLRKAPVSLERIVERVAHALRGVARDQGLELSFRSDRDVTVLADEVRLEQVFGNLISNAIKYTPRGGHVDVSVTREDGEAVVRVRDDGVGIAPEMIARVFDLFAQAERTLDRAQGGLGIGLTLVRSLVHMHGGTAGVNSDGLGKGSEFWARLPTVVADTVSDVSEPEAAPPTASRRILVVEDDVDSRELLTAIVESFGHDVTSVADGLTAVERAPALEPEVALVDIGLPGIDGFAVARRLRATLGDRVLLIALTGYGQPEDQERALEAGFDLHLAKPIDSSRLRRILAERAC